MFVFTHEYLCAYAYLGGGGGGGGMMIANRTGRAVLIYLSCILVNTVYVWWLECVKFGLDLETQHITSEWKSIQSDINRTGHMMKDHCNKRLSAYGQIFCEPVWPSSEASTSSTSHFSSPFSSKVVIQRHCRVTLPLTVNRTSK